MAKVLAEFESRHLDIRKTWRLHFEKIRPHVFTDRPLSETRQLYLGAIFSGEYALEAAALFNPSIVPHPDQSNLAEGELRFIMSLRATGEGHISSIEFRTGVLHADFSVTMEEPSPFVCAPALDPNPRYRRGIFLHKLMEMGFENDWSTLVMKSLGEEFNLEELEKAMQHAAGQTRPALARNAAHDGVRALAGAIELPGAFRHLGRGLGADHLPGFV